MKTTIGWAVGLGAIAAGAVPGACGGDEASSSSATSVTTTTTTGAGAAGGAGATSSATSTSSASGGGCPQGFADCDGDPKTVCETAISSDVDHCGGCDHACPAGAANQDRSCKSSVCGLDCSAGFFDCDGDPSNGCESAASCNVMVLAEIDAPFGLAVDDTYVYYGSRGHAPDFVDGALYKVAKDGSAAPIELATNLMQPLKLTIDDTFVYFGETTVDMTGTSGVYKVPKAGGAKVMLAQMITRPNRPIANGGTLFFTAIDPPDGQVFAVPTDGSLTTTTIASGLVNPRDLQRFGSKLYWITAGTAPDFSDGVLMTSNLDGTGAKALSMTTPIADPSYRMGFDGTNLYIGSFKDMAIWKVPTGAPQNASLFTHTPGLPQEAIVDGGALFVTTASGHEVLSIDLATATSTALAEGLEYPSYLAVDATALYFSDGKLSAPKGRIDRVLR